MKRTIVYIIACFAVFYAAATDRFYIEDSSIIPGETITVSIILENETAYTAFQTDIYLPEGLTIEQEDGDYAFDLTSRKARDHNIASQLQADGAIRIMSYSPSIKTYSGNNGALVTFNVTANKNLKKPVVIELKNTLFTDPHGQEVSFKNESSQIQTILNDLTGEIVFEEGGTKTTAMTWDEEKITIYSTLYISYSGDEDVDYSIYVNDRNLLEDEELSQSISWDESNHRFIVNLYNLIYPFGDQYSANLYFSVTVQAAGYNDISAVHNSFISYTPDKPSVTGYGFSNLSYLIKVEYGGSVHFCNIDGEYVKINNNDDWSWDDSEVYAIKRLDHDYYLTVLAAQKSPMSTVFGFIEKTILIPARECDISISQNEINSAWIVYEYDSENYSHYYTSFDTAKHESGGSFAIIEITSYDSLTASSIRIDSQLVCDDNQYDYEYAINLLPFGDIYGGEHQIVVTITDGFNSLSSDTILEIHPIITRLTPDSLILDIDPNINYTALLVNGEEVELSVDGHHYALERLNHDYSITVQVGEGVYLFGEEEDYGVTYNDWSEETTIVVPAKFFFLGDVDDSGSINISDVTALIDYLLSGNASEVNLFNADCDASGEVNISDVTTLIDYLLSGNWPVEEPVKTSFTVNGVSFDMVEVQGGSFLMGGTPEQGDEVKNREKPVHQVTLSSYNIGQTEVTQELWLAVMGANPSYHVGDLQRPVEQVSWTDCIEFISTLNQLTGKSFRLPTEAEWEYAARGGKQSQGYRYAGGNDMDAVSWYIDNSENTTHPVAIKSPNELGLYDMTGNVWEWTSDWFAMYSEDPQVNPAGPGTGNNRVLRGGCWNGDANYNRISYRDNFTPTGSNSSGGMRLVLDVDNSSKFRLSETVLKVEVDDTKSINILNGGGNYTVAGGTDYVSTSINANQLTVTGIATGTTTVYVTDVETGATAVIAVIVTERQDEEFTVNGVSFKMVTVDGGTFTMGATDEQGSDFNANERPVHQVTLSDYKIGQTEVTQELWQAVMGSNPSNFTGDLQRPVDKVSWNDCQEFISKLNQLTGKSFRLPTEAEWEFAARGGKLSQGFKYAGSNTVDDVAWYKDNSESMTHPVATKAPNELGLYDMSGNVFEWCHDWFGNYSGDAQTNPTGPTSGTYRSCRGGGWGYNDTYCRVSYRSYHSMTSRYDRIGLRLALD